MEEDGEGKENYERKKKRKRGDECEGEKNKWNKESLRIFDKNWE